MSDLQIIISEIKQRILEIEKEILNNQTKLDLEK